MKNVWKYLLVGLLVFVLVFAIGLPFAGGGWAPYRIGPGMMGGYNGFGGFGLFGGRMMLGMILIPLLMIGAVLAGAVALVRGMSGSSATPAGTRLCPNCGKNIQTGWVVCPYCGQKP